MSHLGRLQTRLTFFLMKMAFLSIVILMARETPAIGLLAITFLPGARSLLMKTVTLRVFA